MAEIGPLTLSILVNTQALKAAGEAGKEAGKDIRNEIILTEKELDELIKRVETALARIERIETIENLELAFDLVMLIRGKKIENLSPSLSREIFRQFLNLPNRIPAEVELNLVNLERDFLKLQKLVINLGLSIKDELKLTPQQEKQAIERIEAIDKRLEELNQKRQEAIGRIVGPPDDLGVLKQGLEELLRQLQEIKKAGQDFGILPPGSEESLKEAEDIIKKVKERLGEQNSEFKMSMEILGVSGETISDVEEKVSNLSGTLGKSTTNFEGYGTAISGVDTAANSAADVGLTNLEGKVEDVDTAVSNLNLSEIIKELAGFDPSRFLPGFIKPIIQAKEEVVEVTEEFGDTIEGVQNQGGFFEGIKQGFIDFVENVQSNSELIADFFANTLSQMSQNFSDLFFNIITGKFDDLKDLAKQTFEAILRAFLDLVSAIATRQIVIGIGGLFGIGKGAQAAGGGGNPADIAQQGAGVVGSGLGLFGSGGAFSTLGQGLGLISPGIGPTGAIGPLGVPIIGELAGPGFLATAGAAITVIGAVLAVAALAFTIIAPFLEKTPRLDIDFDSIKTEAGRRAALVSELLDDDFLKDEIIDISVKRKAGLGLGGDEGIKDVLADAIQVAVNNLLDIINKLPTDLAETLSEELLNTPLDTETVVAGERLFEFDAKGKKIAEKFNQLINGEIQAKFLFAVDGFLQTMFESLGVLPEAAEAFLDERFEEFKNAGSREARAKVGQELLADINAFVDAFNIVSGNVNDAIGQTIQSINSLSRKLGFDAVPSIGELTDKLGELIQNAELDAETVQMYADLRNAIVQGISDIINSITGLIGKISQLNSTIVGLGGAAVNIIPFLDEAQAKLVDFYTTNIDNLSLGEQESFLDQILGVANAKLAEEQAAFQRAQEARQRAEEAQRERIQKRIDNLNKEKDKINEVFQKRIEALNEELQIAESFAQLTESIRQTLDSILFSPESVLTGVEQVNALKSNITGLQAQLASSTDPEKQLEIAGRLEEAFKTLFDTAGDAFGVNSPEFVAIFDQVTGGLEGLAGFTEGQGRSVEEISAEIERITAVNEATLKSIDAKIEAAQERLANIGQSTADNTFRASQELTELFEFIRSEYIRILEERFAELGEISEFGFATETEGLSVIAGLTDESLTVLKGVGEETAKQTGYLADIAGRLGTLAGFQRGSEGFRDFGRGTLAVLHGFEAVVTKRDIAAVQDSILHQIAGAGVSGLADRLAGEGDGRDGLSRGGFIAGMRPGGGFVPEFPLSGVRPSPDEPVNHVTEMSVDINVNVNGGSQASIASLAGEIENMMVRSIRQGRVRKELQEAAVRRVG